VRVETELLGRDKIMEVAKRKGGKVWWFEVDNSDLDVEKAAGIVWEYLGSIRRVV